MQKSCICIIDKEPVIGEESENDQRGSKTNKVAPTENIEKQKASNKYIA